MEASSGCKYSIIPPLNRPFKSGATRPRTFASKVVWLRQASALRQMPLNSVLGVLSKLALILISTGCTNNYAQRLLDRKNTDAWPRTTKPSSLIHSVYESPLNEHEQVRAIAYIVSGFHQEGYAVFLSDSIAFTGVAWRKTTAKGQSSYREKELVEVISSLEKRGVCSPEIRQLNRGSGDYLAYKDQNGLRFCFEDGGYWDESNQLQRWFWSTYADSMAFTYSHDQPTPNE